MIKQKQLFKHDPDNGTYGDCCRTALACLLDVKPEEIPHIGEAEAEDGELFNKHFEEVLLTRGYYRITLPCDGQQPLENVLAMNHSMHPLAYYLLIGTSRNGTPHVVICCGDKIVWDPAIDDSGIVGPCADGYYYLIFLVPTNLIERNLQ